MQNKTIERTGTPNSADPFTDEQGNQKVRLSFYLMSEKEVLPAPEEGTSVDEDMRPFTDVITGPKKVVMDMDVGGDEMKRPFMFLIERSDEVMDARAKSDLTVFDRILTAPERRALSSLAITSAVLKWYSVEGGIWENAGKEVPILQWQLSAAATLGSLPIKEGMTREKWEGHMPIPFFDTKAFREANGDEYYEYENGGLKRFTVDQLEAKLAEIRRQFKEIHDAGGNGMSRTIQDFWRNISNPGARQMTTNEEGSKILSREKRDNADPQLN